MIYFTLSYCVNGKHKAPVELWSDSCVVKGERQKKDSLSPLIHYMLPQLATMWPAAHDLQWTSCRQFPTPTGNHSAQTQFHTQREQGVTVLKKWAASRGTFQFGLFIKKTVNIFIGNRSENKHLEVDPKLPSRIYRWHVCLIISVAVRLRWLFCQWGTACVWNTSSWRPWCPWYLFDVTDIKLIVRVWVYKCAFVCVHGPNVSMSSCSFTNPSELSPQHLCFSSYGYGGGLFFCPCKHKLSLDVFAFRCSFWIRGHLWHLLWKPAKCFLEFQCRCVCSRQPLSVSRSKFTKQ